MIPFVIADATHEGTYIGNKG